MWDYTNKSCWRDQRDCLNIVADEPDASDKSGQCVGSEAGEKPRPARVRKFTHPRTATGVYLSTWAKQRTRPVGRLSTASHR